MKSGSILFIFTVLVLFLTAPLASANVHYGVDTFNRGSITVKVSAETSAIGNWGDITFDFRGEKKTKAMDDGSDPYGSNNSGEATMSDGTKFRLKNGRIQYKRPGGSWLYMKMQGQRKIRTDEPGGPIYLQ